MATAGERVMAIESINEETVYLFGSGIYEGNFPRPEDSAGVFGTPEEIRKAACEVWGPLESWTIDQRKAFDSSLCNPRIRLDTGDVVWGCQCWWGPEDEVRSSIGDRKVVMVPVPDRKGA